MIKCKAIENLAYLFIFGPREEGLLAPNRWNGNVYDADIHIT